MKINVRTFTALSAAAVLAFATAACGGDDDDPVGDAAAAEQTEQVDQQQPEPVAAIDDVTGRTTKVTLDAAFVQALTDLGLTPAPLGDASVSQQGVATFPITGGNVKYFEPGTVSPFVQGELRHDGSGLSLTSQDGKTVELTDFVIDPGASVLTGKVTVDGEVAAESAPLFFLDGRTLQPLRTNDSGSLAILEGTTVKFKDESAQLLNETFGVDALQGGLEVGRAKITLDTGA